MKVGVVRIIDYWVGIPLCFGLTVFHYLLRIFTFSRKDIGEPKKFLFIELSEMGSTIQAYPAMKYIKEKYGDAEIFFMIFEKNRASVDILGIIKNLMSAPRVCRT